MPRFDNRTSGGNGNGMRLRDGSCQGQGQGQGRGQGRGQGQGRLRNQTTGVIDRSFFERFCLGKSQGENTQSNPSRTALESAIKDLQQQIDELKNKAGN